MDELTAANLVKEARAAAAAGDVTEAERLTRRSLEIWPDNKEAWLLLAAFLDDADEKRGAIQRALAIDPFYEEAKAALARLDGQEQAADEPEILYCANHPDRETMLRCNKCNKPICMECAIQTPVGYRCPECVREQQDKFYTAELSDQTRGYIVAVLAGFFLGFVAILLNMFLAGFFGWIIAFFIGPALGGALSEGIWRATGRKRARGFDARATGLVVFAAGLMILASIALLGRLPITAAIVLFTAASAIYARLH